MSKPTAWAEQRAREIADEFLQAGSGTYMTGEAINVLAIALDKTRAEERRACARIVIEYTRIPEDALRRGTGVRDRLVIEGENIANAILRHETMSSPLKFR